MADGTPSLRDLTKLPVFGCEHALCDGCELKGQRDREQIAYAYRPRDFNGVMIVGEGPGQQEVAQRRPFVGLSGQLLRQILDSIGEDLDRCYVTNATLCKPPPKGDALHTAFPNAVPSCLPRLEAEIAAVRPRVIVTLGAAAFIAVTGYDKVKHVNEAFDCSNCNENRKVGPVLQCSAPRPNPEDGGKTVTACNALHFLQAKSLETVNPAELLKMREAGCQSCGAKMRRQRPKFVKCPQCGGRKMRSVEKVVFSHDYSLMEVAGAVFQPGVGEVLQQNELDPWLGEQGVRYIVPTLHPAFLMRDQQFATKSVQKHLQRAFALVNRAPRWSEDFEVTTDPEVVRRFTAQDQNYAVDTETEALVVKDDGTVEHLDAREVRNVTKIRCIGIATTERALVVDTRNVDPRNEDDTLLNALQDFLESKTPKTFHNALYDIPVIDRVWGIPWDAMVGSYTDDTLGAHANVYPDESHDLSYVAREMLEAPAWKPPKRIHGALAHKDFEQLALYNARDCLATARSREALGVDRGHAIPHARMARAKLERVYEIDSHLRQLAIAMTMRGMPLDREAFRAAGETAKANEATALADARQLLKEKSAIPEPANFNPFAHAQVADALFSERGFRLPVLSVTAQSKPSTAASDIRRLLSRTDIDPDARAFVQAMLDFREHHKISATYIESPSAQPWEDGRVHPIWKPWGTRTGRFSSSPNAQNWPPWLRAIVVAPEGRAIVGADYDQLELRGSAALAGDPALIHRCMTADETRKLEPDCDPHSFVASLAFGPVYVGLPLKDPAHVTSNGVKVKCRCGTCKRKALRDLVKRVVYGLNYGAGEQTVLEAIYSTGDYVGPPITIEMVAHVKRTYFKTFPEVPKWRDTAAQRARETGELRSPLHGRRRIFPLDDVPLTEIYNYPIQCVTPDTLVLTTDGYRAIGTLAATCTAGLGQGLYRDALRVDKAAERVWEVELSDGARLRTNGDHKLCLLDNAGGDFQWEAVGNLQPGDLIARTLAVPQVFGSTTDGTEEDFFWLGYWIGNGGWSARSEIGFHFGTRVHLSAHQEYAARWLTWARSRDYRHQKPKVMNELTSIISTSTSLKSWLSRCGIDPTWRAITKRVPSAVWSAALLQRQSFLRGFLEADGSLGTDPPSVNTPNRALLTDLQLLARTCGVTGRIAGPYITDRKGHLAWRLSLAGSLLARYVDYGSGVRERHAQPALCARIAVQRFLEATTTNTFSYKTQQSFYVLRARLAAGGQTNAHTLARLRAAAGLLVDPELYAPCEIRSVTPLDEVSPMHTLLVQDPLHRYDSAAVISKNSVGADIMNEQSLLFIDRLPNVDPSAFVFAQVHDALYIECAEDHAEAVARLLEDSLTVEHVLREGAPAMRFSAHAKVMQTWAA